MIRYLSEKTASYIVRNDPSADYEILVYGYELLFQEIGVVIITLLLSLPFGLFFHVLIALISYNLLRGQAGGMHAKYRAACITTSVLIMFAPAFLFGKVGVILPLAAIPAIYVFDLILLLLYAPADTETKPVQNPRLRKKMKLTAVAYLTFFFGSAMLLQSQWPGYAGVLTVTSAIVCCFTHPLAYWLYGCEKSKMTTMEVTV